MSNEKHIEGEYIENAPGSICPIDKGVDDHTIIEDAVFGHITEGDTNYRNVCISDTDTLL